MTSISIIGTGKMGSAIATMSVRAGARVQVLRRRESVTPAPEQPGVEYAFTGEPLTGDLVLPALQYAAIPRVLDVYRDELKGKVLIDISNPINFATFDRSIIPDGSSAAEEIARLVPDSAVVKAFNINFGQTLTSGVNGGTPTAVMIAGDDVDAKVAVKRLVEAAGLRAIDIGRLRLARELEAFGFLQITLAALAKTSWDAGFALV